MRACKHSTLIKHKSAGAGLLTISTFSDLYAEAVRSTYAHSVAMQGIPVVSAAALMCEGLSTQAMLSLLNATTTFMPDSNDHSDLAAPQAAARFLAAQCLSPSSEHTSQAGWKSWACEAPGPRWPPPQWCHPPPPDQPPAGPGTAWQAWPGCLSQSPCPLLQHYTGILSSFAITRHGDLPLLCQICC